VIERCLVLDFCGTRLRIAAPNEEWTNRFQRYFPAFVVSDDTRRDSDFELHLCESAAPTPNHDLPLTTEGIQNDGYFGRVFENERMIVLEVDGGGVTAIDHIKRRAEVVVRPGSYPEFFGTAVIVVVDAMLAAAGQHLTHGASLIEPQTGLAVLVVAASGGGKTTTSLALAHAGFQLMTDDASVLIPGAPRPRIWGLPRALKVHRQTAEMLHWLGSLPDRWDKNQEQGVATASLADRIAIAPVAPIELGAIMLLGPRSEFGDRVEPMSKGELLIALAHDNVAWRRSGMTPKALRRFEVFARAVAQVPAFRISAGSDLAQLPELVSAAMSRAGASKGSGQ
jgi:hypothetical protein